MLAVTSAAMSTESLLVSEVVAASPERLFNAWMDSDEHAAFTGDIADIEPTVGGVFMAFGGYITGRTLALDPGRRIFQTWRTTEFPASAPDSMLEVTFDPTLNGTTVTLLHTEIPAGQGDEYRDGWIKFYLEPLKKHFAGRVTNGAPLAGALPASLARAQPLAAVKPARRLPAKKLAAKKPAAKKPAAKKPAAKKPAAKKRAAKKPAVKQSTSVRRKRR